MNKKTKKVTPFERKGKGWELKVTLEAPEQANAVRKNWQSNQRSSFAPAISLVDMLQTASSKEEPDDEPDDDEPLFRLAAPGK